jgi:hypothetical protein
MISTTLHLLACISVAVAALYWKHHASVGDSVYRQMLPFVIASGLLALLILYQYFMEFFVASYSGAIYEVGGLTRGRIAWTAISVFLMLLPLVGLIPAIGRQALLLLVIACLAAVPSVVSLVSYTSNHQAEQDGASNGG